MKILIFLGGEKPSPDLSRISAHRADWIIAADSGFDAACKTGVQPNVVTGDFDSIEFVPEAGECQVVPAPEQDATDFQKALRQIPKDAGSIEILGGTGLRSDHFLTNLLIAASLPEGMPVVFHDDTQSIYRITPSHAFAMPLRKGTIVSLIPFAESHGVRTAGLHWNLSGDSMGPGQMLGQSNCVDHPDVSINLDRGILYAVVNHPNGLDEIPLAEQP